MSWTFCSKQDVVGIHPVTEQELRDEWSDMVEALIKQYLGQPNLGEAVTITDEYLNGDGSTVMAVKSPPIDTVISLIVDGVTLTAGDYVVFESYIHLKYAVFPRGNLNVVLSYTTKSTVSEIVRLAAVAMIISIVNYRKRGGADASLKWSSLDSKIGEQTPGVSLGLTEHLNGVMKSILRKPRLRVY